MQITIIQFTLTYPAQRMTISRRTTVKFPTAGLEVEITVPEGFGIANISRAYQNALLTSDLEIHCIDESKRPTGSQEITSRVIAIPDTDYAIQLTLPKCCSHLPIAIIVRGL